MSNNPLDKAREQLEQANYRYQLRQSDRVRSVDNALQPTDYQGYSASLGLPQTSNLYNDSVVADGYLLTNAGLSIGQALEPGFRSFDSMPRTQSSRTLTRNTTEDPQIAVLIQLSIRTDDPVKGIINIPGRLYLKIDNKPLIVLDESMPLDEAEEIDSYEVSAVIPIGLNQWTVQVESYNGSPVQVNLINKIYHVNRSNLAVFQGVSEEISVYPGFYEYIYPANSIGDYLLRGQEGNKNNIPDEYYYPVVYLDTQSTTGVLYDPFFEKTIAPYKRKWMQPTWNSLSKEPANWINLLRGIDIGVSISPEQPQEISRGSFIRISLADIQAMNVPTDRIVYTGIDGDPLGTFEQLTSGLASTIPPQINTQVSIPAVAGGYAEYLFTINFVKAILS